MVQKSFYTDTEAHGDQCLLASSGPSNKGNIFLGLIKYALDSLLGAKISVHIRLDLERYLLNVFCPEKLEKFDESDIVQVSGIFRGL